MEKNNYIDVFFSNIVKFINENTYESLFNIILNNFKIYNKKNPILFRNICKFYNDHNLWGTIDLENIDYTLIKNNAKALINNIDNYVWLYNSLKDYRSKKILCYVIYYWIMLDDSKIKELIDNTYSQYFDLDLIKCNKNEIFVDVGAYIGDTLIDYIRKYGKENYTKVYCYEIVPKNIEELETLIFKNNLKNISVRNVGVSNKNDFLYLELDEKSSTKKLVNSGNLKVNSVKVDDDIKGKVTYVKMDIEGGEYNAIIGMKEKIKKYKPKLAICLYHSNDDLWKIPKLIHEINKNYSFYIRYYGGPIMPTEYVLYAV